MTPAEKDAAVREVLHGLPEPLPPRLRPSEIADRLNASRAWLAPSETSLRGALKRIGAVRHPGGRYSAPPAPQPAREPLTHYICVSCHNRTADYLHSRASGEGRKCRECVERGA